MHRYRFTCNPTVTVELADNPFAKKLCSDSGSDWYVVPSGTTTHIHYVKSFSLDQCQAAMKIKLNKRVLSAIEKRIAVLRKAG